VASRVWLSSYWKADPLLEPGAVALCGETFSSVAALDSNRVTTGMATSGRDSRQPCGHPQPRGCHHRGNLVESGEILQEITITSKVQIVLVEGPGIFQNEFDEHYDVRVLGAVPGRRATAAGRARSAATPKVEGGNYGAEHYECVPRWIDRIPVRTKAPTYDRGIVK